MDKYTNPQPPEGINTSLTHPVLTLVKLLAGILVVMAAVAWLLGKSGGWLATLVPFAQEVRLSEAYPESAFDASAHPELRAYLDGLTARLIPGLDLPEGLSLRLHYQNEDIENAFATLGGNILLYKGLLRALPNENSLAMLIAHEAAHIKLRHPIRSVGQNMAISSGIKLLMGYSSIEVLGSSGLYTRLHFSRAMESEADRDALYAVYQAYGHVAGASDLFAALHARKSNDTRRKTPAFFSTHPLDQTRITALHQLAAENEWRNHQQDITPLPAAFMRWLEAE